mgnify:CR=1 FL=1
MYKLYNAIASEILFYEQFNRKDAKFFRGERREKIRTSLRGGTTKQSQTQLSIVLDCFTSFAMTKKRLGAEGGKAALKI